MPREHDIHTADQLLSLENRFDTLLGEVFRRDQWLESVDGDVGERMRKRRVEREREEAVDQLRSTSAQLQALRKGLE